MKTIETSIDIDAPPARVWSILMDFDAYPDWNPFITRIEGEQREGGKLRADLTPAGGKTTTFKPTVQVFEDGRELTWLGRLLIPGIFDGRHTLRVQPRDDASTFIQREQFAGLISGLLLRFIGENTEQGFKDMNAALKERAEAG